jgi:kynureninase
VRIHPNTGKCRICQHPDRDRIDQLLVMGTPVRVIAGQFPPLAYRTVAKHGQFHLPEKLREAFKRQEMTAADALIAENRDLVRRLNVIADKGMDKTSAQWHRAAIQAMRAAGERIDSLGRLLGVEQLNVSVTASLSQDVVDMIILTLAPWPDARQAMAERLQALALGQAAVTELATIPAEIVPISKGH